MEDLRCANRAFNDVEVYREGDTLFTQPPVVVPLKAAKYNSPPRDPGGAQQQWVKDGKSWHLEERCSPTTKACFVTIARHLSQ